MSNIDSRFISVVAEYICKNIVKDIPQGQNIVVREMNISTARDLASKCNELVRELGFPELRLFALGSEDDLDRYVISAQKAIEFRNSMEPLVLIAPTSNAELVASLAGFKSYRMTEIVTALIHSNIAEMAKLDLPSFTADVLKSLLKITTLNDLLTFLLTVKLSDNPQETFASNLPEIGLIADSSVGLLEPGSIVRNIQISSRLNSKSNPLRDIEDLLTNSGLLPGKTRDAVKEAISLERVSGLGWSKHLSIKEDEDYLLVNWPLVESSSIKFALLEIKSFLGPDGELNSKCKLKPHPTKDVFVSTGKVHIEWVVLPKITGEGIRWQIDLLNSADIQLARSIQKWSASHQARSKTLDLSDIEEDGVPLRIQITALTKEGAQVLSEDGSVAVAYSESFILQGEADSDLGDDTESSEKVSQSLGSALVLNALQNKSLKKLPELLVGRPDRTKQCYEIALENTITRIRFSSLVRELVLNSIEKSSELISYESLYKLSDSSLEFKDIREIVLDATEDFRIARANFLQCMKNEHVTLSPELIYWTKEQEDSLMVYLETYRALLDTQDSEAINPLLSLDQLKLKVYTPSGDIDAVILLPTHPLRAAWLLQHFRVSYKYASELLKVDFNKRSSEFDFHLFDAIKPENLPFIIPSEGKNFVYIDELVFGTGIYFPAEVSDITWQLSIVSQTLGVRPGSKDSDLIRKLSNHLSNYDSGNSFLPGLRIAAVNPGDGSLIAGALSGFLSSMEEHRHDLVRLEVSAYASNYSIVDPISKLSRLQSDLNVTDEQSRHLLLPRLSLKAFDIKDLQHPERQNEFVNLSVLQAPAQISVSSVIVENNHPRGSLMNGLINYVYEIRNAGEATSLFTVSLDADQQEDFIPRLHKAYLSSVLGSTNTFNFEIRATGDVVNLVRNIHSHSDWVLTADRYLGLNLYENMLKTEDASPVVLDYSPDFVDGFGDRLTLTTTRPDEVSRILHNAMRALGIEEGPQKNATTLLRTLTQVSGRLAMRLLADTSLAKEAVGICATISYLEEIGDLKNTIIIPIDAHQDMFKLSKYDVDSDSQRCDLIFVRFEDEGIVVELVEVKARSTSEVGELPQEMQNQLDNSERLLNRLLFNDGGNRIDSKIQWSRWASILHFYIDRAFLHKRVSSELVGKFHDLVEIHVSEQSSPRLIKSGYIVSVNAQPDELGVERPGYKIRVLADKELQASGYYTIKHHYPEVQVAILSPEVEVETTEIPEFPSEQIVEGHEAPKKDVLLENENLDAISEIEHSGDIQVILGKSRTSESLTWKVSLSGSPHAVIVGIPGQGKSVTTRNILRQFSAQGLPSIVFDFHGDMSTADLSKSNYVKVATEGLPFSPFDFDRNGAIPIKTASLEISEILKSIGSLGEIQANHVNQALRLSYANLGWSDSGDSGARLPNVSEFVSCLEQVENQNKGKNALARLQSFTDYELFRDGNLRSFNVLDPKGYVFDVSKYRLEEVKVTAGAFILRKIYNEMFQWEPTHRPRLAVVLDEAHRLAKDPTIPKIMKEGRKFGIIVVLVSQSMKDFAPEVIDNAGMKIAFRTNFPASKEVASFLQSKDSNQIATVIEALNTGYALVSTPEMKNVEKVEMRNSD